ncbi:MAG: DUF1292 domain-containing protein [Clostridiaceae bacterium]|nr:DUF1292 domain-containing protein [Clostridiaceae bacterium]
MLRLNFAAYGLWAADGAGSDGGADDAHDHQRIFDDLQDDYVVTMEDVDSGEVFEFQIVDDFEFNGEVYCVLMSLDKEADCYFVRVADMEDGSEGFVSLEDDEFEAVSEEYDRLCEISAESDDEWDDLDMDDDDDEDWDDDDIDWELESEDDFDDDDDADFEEDDFSDDSDDDEEWDED